MLSIVAADEAALHRLCVRNDGEPPVSGLVMRDGTTEIGYILYRVTGTECVLLRGQAPDEVLLEGLVRAALNAALSNGAETALCGEESLFPLLSRLRFVKTDNCFRILIREFFNHSCCGK